MKNFEIVANNEVFQVQKKLWKEDKVFVAQITIIKIMNECIENGCFNGWKSLYLNCVIDGIDSLVNYNKAIKEEITCKK